MQNSNENLVGQALSRYYSHLNPMQREAVFQVEGPVLILAGAGSGKTTVLINRIDYMIRFGNMYFSKKKVSGAVETTLENYLKSDDANSVALETILSDNPIEPWKILAITFTNKAAGELKERLLQRLGETANSIQASTFHSFCVRILRREIGLLGYNSSFAIYDTDDSLRIIKDGMKLHQIDDKMLPPRSVLSAISKAKDNMHSAEDLLKQAAGDYRMESIARVYAYYQKTLQAASALDFDDIILLTVIIFQQHPERLDYYQNRYQYIMVDEYQDTNQTQYLLVSLLAQKRKNLCVVGDDDQSIYKFRGATIENILSFEKQFEGAKVIRLEQNYRSTQNILSAANAVIANNMGRKGKNLWTDKGEGEKIAYVRLADELQEARTIADSIEQHVESGKKWSDHAVLYRMNAQSNTIERSLAQRAIPYRIVGGLRFYERKEIKDIIAYLSIINNPNDDLRFMRVINEPKRGLGTVTTDTLQEIAESMGESVYQAAAGADQFAPLSAKSGTLLDFIAMIESFRKASESISLPALLDKVLEDTGYLRSLEAQGEEGITRIENLLELKSNMISYEEEQEETSLSGFLEEIALYTDLDTYENEVDTVVLMTIHSAKGLEFPVVYILGMDEGIFPGRNAQNFPEEIEEERRLAYVAITRAKETLVITGAERRMLFGQTMWGRPSRFVEEIPAEYITREDKTAARTSGTPKITKFSAAQSKDSSQSIGIGAAKNRVDVQTYTQGDQVKHKIFGIGTIENSSPMGNDTLLDITFDKVGKKRIMANFAKLEKL